MEMISDWVGVVGKIQQQDASGVEDLYTLISGVVRANLSHVVESYEDDLHEILLIVIEAILRGELRDPERLRGFVRTVARRRAVAHIRGNIDYRRRFVPNPEVAPSPDPSPEQRAASGERERGIRYVLASLRRRDREILVRFYIQEQRPEQICAEMSLTSNQFRLFKSRALARCARYAAGVDIEAV
jgi:RNA polymerase sigma-70 factor, ECF subfamily